MASWNLRTLVGRVRLTSPARLRAAGVLGMNARNHAYVEACNPRALLPRVDDKLLTKLLCRKHGIATPPLVGAVRSQHELRRLGDLLEPLPDFVVKPAHGSGGRGILVVADHSGGRFRKAGGEAVELDAIRRHVSNTLSGMYSLGGRPDTAFLERCIRFSDVLERFTYQGVPDLRVIVYQGFPVMAMMRVSTRRSDGKANLHQGAVGVGLDLSTGHACAAVQHNRPIHRHPDTDADFAELQVPQWREHLELATRSFEMTGLGYFGADIVLDARRGPMVLELNARPGLAIQTANRAGLTPRLQHVAARPPGPLPAPAERVEYARHAFGVDRPGP